METVISQTQTSHTNTKDLVQRALDLGAIQIREEISQLVELLKTVKLHNVMEIGSESGGTFYLWCRLAALGGLKISLDKPDGDSGSGRFANPRALAARISEFQSWAPRVRIITGDSHSERIWEEVSRTLALGGDKLDFLFIDGDHSYEGVKADWEDYRGFVRPGGLVAFHDINDSEHHQKRGCYVAKFWAELEGAKREFNQHWHWGGIGVVAV